MTDIPPVLTEETKKRLIRARQLVDAGKIELDKARRAGLTDVVQKMEGRIKQADERLRQLESVYR